MYSSLEKIVSAFVTIVKKLQHYFETHIVVVMTNYPIKWAIVLSGYDIKYLPRKTIKS